VAARRTRKERKKELGNQDQRRRDRDADEEHRTRSRMGRCRSLQWTEEGREFLEEE
jgi:hypothetical protein